MSFSRIPVATYRLQFNDQFRLSDATHLLDYLAALGITDIYASPILVSRKGSGHGYDVTDPARVNPEIGGEEQFEKLHEELQKRGMGLVLDVVPNHMAASSENRWWMDVLENGSESAHASYFDIDWHPHSRNLDRTILLPVLGRPFGETLDGGELRLILQDGKFFIQYFDSFFPLAPRSYGRVLKYHVEDLKNSVGENSPSYDEYLGIIFALSSLSERDLSALTPGERRLKFESCRERLKILMETQPAMKAFIDSSLSQFNGNPSDPASFCNLEQILADQNYRLAYWQDVNEGINYRRFFAISDLVGVRIEDPVVFEATHEEVFRLISKGGINGLRIDHIDGLWDPVSYLRKLRERVSAVASVDTVEPYVLVEKILEPNEVLPQDWPVSGTTGYDYLNWVNGVFVSPAGARKLRRIYTDFIGRKADFADILYDKKKQIMNSLLRVEIQSLGRQLGDLAGKDRYARDILRSELTSALIETTAALSVYRTYVRNLEIPPVARNLIDDAINRARARKPRMSPECFNFLRDVLLLLNHAHVLPEQREERLVFVMRWQQFTGPIMAKGMEDTALYVYYPLLSLNEVGGSPESSMVTSREEFYDHMRERQRTSPISLNATSTHDTKRSEDIRARLNVLSEIPDEWQEHIKQWARVNDKHRESLNGQQVPDANEEYLIYQTLLGLWPLDGSQPMSIAERLQAYLVKATREAMIHTRWTAPDEPHENALSRFIELILGPANAGFLQSFCVFQKKISYCGMINGLSQVLLKITCPGVPDFYQGSELWDFHLVDPDNRQPIDFVERAGWLESEVLRGQTEPVEFMRDLVEHWPDGRIKFHLIREALSYRLQHRELFSGGEFVPLTASGPKSTHVISYLRRDGHEKALILVPRWLARCEADSDSYREFWRDTYLLLPPDAGDVWSNLFTHEQVRAKPLNRQKVLPIIDLLLGFPVAMLEPIK